MKKIMKMLFVTAITICVLVYNTFPVSAAPNGTQSGAEQQAVLTNLTFDMNYYYNTNPDLQGIIGYDYTELFNHYVSFGMQEGRWGSAEFNCLAYKNNYPDLQVAFGNDYLAYCVHYETCGKAEGRSAVSTDAVPEPVDTPVSVPVEIVMIGTYTTRYNPNIPRAVNVIVSASRINGVILEPGAPFSYSHTVLPRTPQNGYVQAPVIVNGEYEPGYGGGICQVSSTLYAAMLNANLPATQRHPHSLPVSYIPVGMDATISGTRIDLQFVNIYDYPLLITACADTGILTVTLSLLVPTAQ